MRILAVRNDNTGHRIVCLCLDWWLCLCCCMVVVGGGGIVVSRGWTAAFLQDSSGKHDNKDRDTKTQLLSPPLFLWLLCESLCVYVWLSVWVSVLQMLVWENGNAFFVSSNGWKYSEWIISKLWAADAAANECRGGAMEQISFSVSSSSFNLNSLSDLMERKPQEDGGGLFGGNESLTLKMKKNSSDLKIDKN